MKRGLILPLFLACASCEIDPGRAPVSDRMEPVARHSSTAPAASVARPKAPQAEVSPAEVPQPEVRPYRNGDSRADTYVVKKGDTLYSIALDHGEDYREVAQWNNIADPAIIKIGQALRMTAPATSVSSSADPAVAAPESIPLVTEPKPRRLPFSDAAAAEFFPSTAALPQKPVSIARPSPAKEAKVESRTESKQDLSASDDTITWGWPTQGKVIYEFGEGTNSKGMAIDGKIGQPVAAAAAGKVVYSGSGLRGYGKLVIIKHNATYLSVYAHNQQLLVHEGQFVKQGQRIAEMGNSEFDRVALHFEIRRFGKPVDPQKFLPAVPKSSSLRQRNASPELLQRILTQNWAVT